MTIYPISPYQKRFWLEWKLNPHIPQYNTPLIYRILGELNIPKLEEALSIFIHQYYDASLGYFEETNEGPVQKFLETIPVILRYHENENKNEKGNSNGNGKDQRFKSTDDFIAQMTQHVFDLSKAPLFDFNILKKPINMDKSIEHNDKNNNQYTHEYILVLNFHHIITDAASAMMLTEKLSAIYNSLMDQHFSLPLLPPKRFTEYLTENALQQKQIEDNQKNITLEYWISKLETKNCFVELTDLNKISQENFQKEKITENLMNKQMPNQTLVNKIDLSNIYYFTLKSELAVSLKKLAREQKTTLFLTLTALFSALIHRYTEQDDIVLTYPINARPANCPLIGSFVNMIPIITSFNPHITFVDLIAKLTRERKEAKCYQNVILTDVIQQLRLRQKSVLPANSFFNIAIGEAFLYSSPLKLSDLTVTAIQPNYRYAFNDLYFYYEVKDNDTIECRLDYRSNLFSPQFIEKFAHHFQRLLEIFIKNPMHKISDITLISDQEIQKIFYDGNMIRNLNQNVSSNSEESRYEFLNTDHAGNGKHHLSPENILIKKKNQLNQLNDHINRDLNSIENLFLDQVKKTPDNVAVRFLKQSITYQELDRMSGELANTIQSHEEWKNQKQGNRKLHIGIFLPRSIEQVIAILAILKSNAIYIPLSINDPHDPIARITAKIQCADIDIILSNTETFKKFQTKLMQNKDSIGFKTIEFKTVEFNKWMTQTKQYHSQYPLIAAYPLQNTAKPNYMSDSASRPAYIMFTSGTTQFPKAVVVGHHSVINLVQDAIKKFNIIKQDSNNTHNSYKILSLTSIAFDIYGLELYAALLTGSEHIICAEEIIQDPKKLMQTILTIEPNLIQATPTQWSMLIQCMTASLTPIHFPCTFLVGGEVLSQHLAKSLLILAGQLGTVWNVYGPTETTIWSTYHPVKQNYAGEIGRPFANNILTVLDKYKKPVPIGVKGELYIGGSSLALGYYHSAIETEAAFVELFSSRFYKTGDFVVWTEEGELVYLGRHDNQIKIRGHRIHLEEIEYCLQQNPKVEQIKVVLKDECLICFYTLKKKDGFNFNIFKFKKLSIGENVNKEIANELTSLAQKKLPKIMRPTQYVQLDKIPINTNGKIDINALRSRHPREDREPIDYYSENNERPYDLIELEIKYCWNQVFTYINPNINQVIPLNVPFLEAGGDSLSLIHLSTLLSDKFKMSCSVNWINQYSTVLKQAEFIRELREHNLNTELYQPIVHLNKNSSLENNSNNLNAIFLIHPALAGVECYDELSQYFKIPVYGIDSYNLNSGKEMLLSIEKLAKNYISYLKELQPKGPYTLGGWSLGGLIAYEMAQILKSNGDKINHLFLLDTHIYRQDYLLSTYDLAEINDVIEHLPPNWKSYYHKLSQNHLDKIFQSFKNDIYLSLHYEILPYNGEVTLFRSTEKTNLTPGIIEKTYNGWKSYIKDLTLIPVKTSHYELIKGSSAKQIAEVIKSSLESFRHLSHC